MTDKPIALDLCCGKGGWTKGLHATGWDVIGFDTENWGYPGHLVIQDVRTIDGTRFKDKIKLVVASPPCQEFSYRSFPFKRCRYLRDNVPPDTTIWEACVRIAKEVEAPLILENVRSAVRYMGKAAGRFGPFYLWGDVPALLPDGKPQKGFGKSYANKDRWKSLYQSRGGKGPLNGLRDKKYKSMVGSEKHQEFSRGKTQFTSSKSQARKEWSAKAAMIPYELAYWIGTVFNPEYKR